MKKFYDLPAFQEQFPKKAEHLLHVFGQGEWEQEELLYFTNLSDYAAYEVYQGQYSDLGLERDYGGAPELVQFIDYERLGDALRKDWYRRENYCFSDGSVIRTSCGF